MIKISGDEVARVATSAPRIFGTDNGHTIYTNSNPRSFGLASWLIRTLLPDAYPCYHFHTFSFAGEAFPVTFQDANNFL